MDITFVGDKVKIELKFIWTVEYFFFVNYTEVFWPHKSGPD